MTAHKHAELMALYAQDAAETDEPWERWEYKHCGGEWIPCADHPNWFDINEYRRKPQMKVVDLSVLIKSGIDCEFYDKDFDMMYIGKLVKLNNSEYMTEKDTYDCCRPRMNHWHHWNGGEYPLPEGFNVEVMDRIGVTHIGDASYFNWKHNKDMLDIIAFKVIGLADGYCWPWELDNG